MVSTRWKKYNKLVQRIKIIDCGKFCKWLVLQI